MATTSKWTPPAPGEVRAPNLIETHNDIHSQANLFEIKPQHIHIDWHVDWEKRTLSGRVTHTVKVTGKDVSQVVLDTSYLDIKKVALLSDGSTESSQELKWELGKRKGTIGTPLTIHLGQAHKTGDVVKFAIDYSTTEKCTALGWLSQEQTDSKTMPFLYSQAQAIHARSMLPCVDSPSHKITYTSKVKSKYPVLMSALADGSIRATDTDVGNAEDPKEKGVYHFRQPIGIPSYLIAIVGGNLAFRSLGPRVGVYAEPTMIDKAEWEFKLDANRFLEAAEQTISPYSWTRYDSVVLPPSFPYGGMENANMTTLTPALITSDRSQVNVLLHELSHSWSGNLTSCANWSSFWLNEGINVWIERLLLSVVHGPEAGPALRDFDYIVGQKAMFEAIDQYNDNPRFQRLVPVYQDGEDPDDAFSSIPYEKGSTFIYHLERTVGGLEAFLPFIRSHFAAFYDRSISTEEFKQHIFDFYEGNGEISGKLRKVDWDGWFHGEGKTFPAEVVFDDSLAQQVYKLADRWSDVVNGRSDIKTGNFGPDDIAGWEVDQVVLFLARLREGSKIKAEVAKALDKAYAFHSQPNPEILSGFYGVALQDKATPYAQAAAKWVTKQGRMKYCRPLYRSLYKIMPELARETFIANRSFYHPIAASMIAIDLGLPSRGAKGEKRSTARPKVIAVCGSTGTGKSQLAVEIAHYLARRREHSNNDEPAAEIISADSMQLYKGLDVITNKVTKEEMRGVPHHLIDILDPASGDAYNVGQYVAEARRLIDEIRTRGRMPILVGGTTYYIQHTLFPGRLVTSSSDQEDDNDGRNMTQATVDAQIEQLLSEYAQTLTAEQKQALRAVADSTGFGHESDKGQAIPDYTLWTLLQVMDPEMASRWHFRDRRKVLRSLTVLLTTGQRHSDIIQQQQEEDSEDSATSPGDMSDSLVFWLTCDRDVLHKRLDSRVDKMVKSGLLNEIRELRSIAGRDCQVDYTQGIFQAIGYKEFADYLDHKDKRPDEAVPAMRNKGGATEEDSLLLAQGLDAMKVATRQYAKRQVSWLNNKLAPEVQRQRQRGVNTALMRLDASDLDKMHDNVYSPAVLAMDAFLNEGKLPDDEPRQADDSATRSSQKTFITCDVCTRDEREPFMVARDQWQAHCRGRVHKAAMYERGLLSRRRHDTSAAAIAKREARQALRRHGSGSDDDAISSSD